MKLHILSQASMSPDTVSPSAWADNAGLLTVTSSDTTAVAVAAAAAAGVAAEVTETAACSSALNTLHRWSLLKLFESATAAVTAQVYSKNGRYVVCARRGEELELAAVVSWQWKVMRQPASAHSLSNIPSMQCASSAA